MTPTDPVAIHGWFPILVSIFDPWPAADQPLLWFSDEDVEVKRSFVLFTQGSADRFFFPVSVPDIWRHLISNATWSLRTWNPRIMDVLYEEYTQPGSDRNHWAKDLETLQNIFQTQVKHVEVVVRMTGHFNDEELEERVERPLPKYQWAMANMAYVPSVLETCSSLKSLRLCLDLNTSRQQFGDCYIDSQAFQEIWQYTVPTIKRDGKQWAPFAVLKADCQRRGIEFKIIARMPLSDTEDDLTNFWDFPAVVKPELWDDTRLVQAIERHVGKKNNAPA